MKKLYILIAIILLAVSVLLMLNLKGRGAEAAAEEFFQLLNMGKIEESFSMISPGFSQGRGWAQTLAAAGVSIRTTGVQMKSLSRAEVSAVLETGAGARFTVLLQQENDGWRIVSFPGLTGGTVFVRTVASGEAEAVTAAGKEISLVTGGYQLQAGGAGQLLAVGEEILYFYPFENLSGENILLSGDALLETETGLYQLSQPVYFRQRQGAVVPVAGGLIPAMEDVNLYLQEGEVQAVLLPPEGYIPDNIRVLLNTTGFSGTAHDRAVISAGTPFRLEDKYHGQTFSLDAGESISIVPEGSTLRVSIAGGEERVFTNRLFVTAQGGGLQVASIRRGSPSFIPVYRGRLEVTAREGSLYLVNQVPLEEYLLTVVPSEMPVSFGLEALKVQAVAARSYAAAAMLRSGYGYLGAHVDDSVMSQVYNNVPQRPESSRAVEETAGLVAVTAAGSLVDTRFFSTSCGSTSNAHEVWQDEGGNFPGKEISYLTARSQLRQGTLPDLSSEAGAGEFFGTAGWDAYDRDSPWFRWQVEMSGEELAASVSRNLKERYRADPRFVLTKTGEQYESVPIPQEPLGDLLDLQVVQRGEGGNIMVLDVVGEKGSFRLIKELNIRFALRPVQYLEGGEAVFVRRHDGSRIADYSLMPSAFFSFHIERNNEGGIAGVTFFGGGNGHGAGMSQWGARGLARGGMGFEQILAHYYPGTRLRNIYQER